MEEPGEVPDYVLFPDMEMPTIEVDGHDYIGTLSIPELGLELPVPEVVSFFGFYVLYLAASFGVHYFLRNRVEVCYGLAYDAVKPEEKQGGGVVLGNIFQM